MNLCVVLCQVFVVVQLVILQYVSEVEATIDPVFAVGEASKSIETRINKPLAEFGEPTRLTKRRHPLKKKKRKRKTKSKKGKHKRRTTHREPSSTAVTDSTEKKVKDFDGASANTSHFHWNRGKSTSDSDEGEKRRKPVDIIVHIKMNE